MKIEATDKTLRVDYKKAGKQYVPSDMSEGGPGTNNDTYSTFPFDSAELAPGEVFEETGVEVVRVTELGISSGNHTSTGSPE